MQYSIEGAVRNHIGKVRKNNEDNFFFNGTYLHRNHLLDGGYFSAVVNSERQLYAVCDGMGGEKDGEEASLLTVQNLQRLQRVLEYGGKPKQNIDAFCDDTNRSILTYGQGGHMGTTIVLLCFHENGCDIGYLGDSRVYLVRQNKIHQLTIDHSEVNRLKMMGLINEDEAKRHPDKNMLNKYLGMQYTDLIIRPDYTDYIPKQGDRLLLCSDGVSDMLSEDEIRRTINDSRSAATATKNLVNKALQSGGKDNITAMVLFIRKITVGETVKEKKKRKRSRERTQNESINWYNQDEIDQKKERIFAAGNRRIIKPVIWAIAFLLLVGAVILIALNIGDGIDSIKQLFQGQIKVENSIDVVDEVDELPANVEQSDEIAEALSEEDEIAALVADVLYSGRTSFDINQIDSDTLLEFVICYARLHPESYPQFSRATVSVPGDLEATEVNAGLLSELQETGCYRITQQEVDDILTRLFNVVLEPSNAHANAIYKDATYFISTEEIPTVNYVIDSIRYSFDETEDAYVVDYLFYDQNDASKTTKSGTAIIKTSENFYIESMIVK